VREGGRAVVFQKGPRGEGIFLVYEGTSFPLETETPLRSDRCNPYSTNNALAAAAACAALDIDSERIRQGLRYLETE
jgi:UDP-N-acetylmuramyl tripeptide synthase